MADEKEALSTEQKYPKNIYNIIKQTQRKPELVDSHVYWVMTGAELHRIAKFFRQQEYFKNKEANASGDVASQ